MISHDRLIAKTVVRLAMEDPPMVKAAIARLREQGDIEPDDLVYLDHIADRWMGIAKQNMRQGHPAARAT